jgi:hypothetical protein
MHPQDIAASPKARSNLVSHMRNLLAQESDKRARGLHYVSQVYPLDQTICSGGGIGVELGG